jgi:hypothetical protein
VSHELREPGQLFADEAGQFRCLECSRDAEFFVGGSYYLCRDCLDDMNHDFREIGRSKAALVVRP